MDRQSRNWEFESPIKPFKFWMLTEFVLIFIIKPDFRKTFDINISGYANNIIIEL